ncbi:Palmitoyltransferase ERF2 [Candida viswanathii]|uniref:Palmitoyltransferase n=1 Tax=Candida viswanathii TaxID=5486 RepID=A0A367XSC9_9ASCO|nr:Palmitoyltransferase ERF2 [Candida viswanathii]
MSLPPSRASIDDATTKGELSSFDDSTFHRPSSQFTRSIALKKISPSLSPQYEDQQSHPHSKQHHHRHSGDENDTPHRSRHVSLLHKFITNWLVMDPNLLDNTDKPHVKNYQKVENSKYVFFLGGRLHTIKSRNPTSIITLALIIVPGVLFVIFEASWQWHHVSAAVTMVFIYLWVVNISLFLKLATGDSGRLPKNLHIPKKISRRQPSGDEVAEADGKDQWEVEDPPAEYFNTLTLPYNNEKHQGIQVKYCTTCHVWRPSRTSHCGICDICVLNHDHHCIFLNNCIGQRNYKYFLWFLLVTVINCLYLIVVSVIQLCFYRIGDTDIHDMRHSIRKHPVALLIVVYSVLAFIYPFLLLLFHAFLTSQNITTREYLNYVYKQKKGNFVNVYRREMLRNWYINWWGKSSGVGLTFPLDVYKDGDIRYQTIEPLKTFE